MSDFKIVFIHGYTSSHTSDWYPNISKELDKSGIDYVIPDLPGGEHPHAEEWLNILHEIISTSDKPIILIGHSLGTRTALLYLDKYQPTNIRIVILISAFSNNLENGKRHDGESYPDFFTHLVNINNIKKLAEKFIVIHSTDDKSEEPTSGIDYSQGVEIAKQLNAKLINPEKRGHFDAASNAPFILNVLREELKF